MKNLISCHYNRTLHKQGDFYELSINNLPIQRPHTSVQFGLLNKESRNKKRNNKKKNLRK